MEELAITPIASASDFRAVVPSVTSNSALALAASLRQANPVINQTIQGLQQRSLERASAQARQDILENGAEEAFADAVRSGTIRDTQNPFYIDAYNRERARVRGRAAMAELSQNAANWPERNDPVAFQARLQESISEISQQFPGQAERVGLEPVIAEFQQNIVQQNLSANAKRIQDERETDLRTGLSSAIQDVFEQPGATNPDDVFAATDQARADYLAAGGTDLEFDRALVDAISSAAYQTTDSSVLDLLTVERQGRPTLGDLPKVADQAARDRFNIEGAARNASERANRLRQQALVEETNDAKDLLFSTYGTDILQAQFDLDSAVSLLTSRGVAPEAALAALDEVRKSVTSVSALDQATTDPDNDIARANLELFNEGITRGNTATFRRKLDAAVAANNIDDSSARSFLSQANATSNRFRAEARADAKDKKSQDEENEDDIGYDLSTAAKLRTAMKDLSIAAVATRSRRGLRVRDSFADDLLVQMRGSATQVLNSGGTLQQAYLAAREIYSQAIIEADTQAFQALAVSQLEAELAEIEGVQAARGNNPRR